MATASPEDMAKRTAEFFASAGEDDDLSERLGFAQTILHIHFESENGNSSSGETGCTVWLDRVPVEAEVGFHDQAEIELYASPDGFLPLILGDEAMAMSIVHGHVSYKGPVRKFLRVVPLLRTFEFDAFKGLKPDGHEGDGHYSRDLGVDHHIGDDDDDPSPKHQDEHPSEESSSVQPMSERPDTGVGLNPRGDDSR